MTFRTIGGSLLWNTTPIERADAEWLLELFRTEMVAFLDMGCTTEASKTLGLCNELSAALSVADQWARASGGLQT